MTTVAVGGLPTSILANPMVDDWLRFVPDGAVEVRSGKVELGQGVLTALAQIVAEELDVDLSRLRMTAAATGVSPDEGYTAGSLSVQHSGAALRMAAAEARAVHLEVAARRWGLDSGLLTVTDGVVAAPDGRTASYWELTHAGLLHRRVTGAAPTKAAADRRIVGTRVPRIDLPDKLAGRPRFAHDLALPGMVYGRVVRPPSRAAALQSVDAARTLAMPGVVTVVRDGAFLGVIADREEVALAAAERLRADATWEERATLPDESGLPAFLSAAPAVSTVVADTGGAGRIPLAAKPFTKLGTTGRIWPMRRWGRPRQPHW